MGSNWEWSFQKGRDKRIALEVDARMHGLPFNPDDVPLHSHDGTMQSYFNKGWRSVSAVDVEMRVKGNMDYQQARERLRERFGGHYG